MNILFDGCHIAKATESIDSVAYKGTLEHGKDIDETIPAFSNYVISES
jgi:hypothetical protein